MTSKILFIDDDPTVLFIGEIMLKDLGYEVVTANTGQEGLDKIDDSIDLILLDIMLPDIYGVDILKQIKSSKKIKHIPVIIQTGINDQNEIEKARKLGAKDILLKPYNKDDLSKAISSE